MLYSSAHTHTHTSSEAFDVGLISTNLIHISLPFLINTALQVSTQVYCKGVCILLFLVILVLCGNSIFALRGLSLQVPQKIMSFFKEIMKIENCFFFFFFLGPHLQHMEGPRLGFESEVQLPAYTTTTATRDPSCICGLHRSSQQCWILNPLSEARD